MLDYSAIKSCYTKGLSS